MVEAFEEVKTGSIFQDYSVEDYSFEDFCRFTIRSDRESSVEVIVRQIRTLVQWFELPLSIPTQDDIRRVLAKRLTYRLSREKKKDKITYRLKKGKISNATFNIIAYGLRMWLKYHKIDPDEKQWRELLRARPKRARRVKTRDDLLNENDVITIIQFHNSPMWKAFSGVLWDTGCRPNELFQLDYSDVERDKYGFTFHVKDSKSVSRSLRLITEIGMKYFQSYFTQHSGTGALFKTLRGNRLKSPNTQSVYRRISEKMDKQIWPTLFRKSASTYWKQNALLDDSSIRHRLGHSPWSKIFEKHYHHYFNDDYQEAELHAMGIRSEKKIPERETCSNCGVPYMGKQCPNCNQMRLQAVSDLERRIQSLENTIMSLGKILKPPIEGDFILEEITDDEESNSLQR